MTSVSQIMNRDVTTLDASGTVLDAIRIMTEKSVRCVVITNNAKPVGIITERDVMKAMMEGENIPRRFESNSCPDCSLNLPSFLLHRDLRE